MHLICRLSIPIRKRADKDGSITNAVMTQHKRILNLLREGGIFFIFFLKFNLYISPGLMLLFFFLFFFKIFVYCL